MPNPASAKAFDRYAYVENNPVRYSDPSGHCVVEDTACWDVAQRLATNADWIIQDIWSLDEVRSLMRVYNQIYSYFSSHGGGDVAGRIRAAFGRVVFHKSRGQSIVDESFTKNAVAHVINNNVYLHGSTSTATIIHELGHILDNHQASLQLYPGGGTQWETGPSYEYAKELGFDPEKCGYIRLKCSAYTEYLKDESKPIHTEYVYDYRNYPSYIEDFADAFAGTIQGKFSNQNSVRTGFISKLITSYTNTHQNTYPYKYYPVPEPSYYKALILH